MAVEQTLDGLASSALARLPRHVRDEFAVDPHAALAVLGLTVQKIDGASRLGDVRQGGGACDGTSFLRDGVILYVQTPYSRRENFTLAHELGHFLVDTEDEVMAYLADQDDTLELLESVCDRIAQKLLMPVDAVDAVLTHGPVSAAAVLDLYASTQASRPVCVIALAQRLPCLGAVVIVKDDMVSFASVRPHHDHGWPEVVPWSGEAVPAGHPLKALSAGSTFTRRSFWRNRWGATADFYIDAVHDGSRIFAVLAERDLWASERLHLDRSRDYDTRGIREVTCCGQTRQVRGYPCPTCQQGYCPVCKQCACEKAAQTEQLCSSCYLSFRPHLLRGGRCEDCR